MEYVSIDLETTGLNWEKHQILEFGAIFEDTLNPLPFDEIPKFHAIIAHDDYVGSAFAINMNQRIFEILKGYEGVKFTDDLDEIYRYEYRNNICKLDDLAADFYDWCLIHITNKPKNVGDPIKLNYAGKNFATFDENFLVKLPDWRKKFARQHRIIDPSSMFWNPIEDFTLPNTTTCAERAGVNSEVTHDAIGDAFQVIEILRTKY